MANETYIVNKTEGTITFVATLARAFAIVDNIDNTWGRPDNLSVVSEELNIIYGCKSGDRVSDNRRIMMKLHSIDIDKNEYVY